MLIRLGVVMIFVRVGVGTVVCGASGGSSVGEISTVAVEVGVNGTGDDTVGACASVVRGTVVLVSLVVAMQEVNPNPISTSKKSDKSWHRLEYRSVNISAPCILKSLI